MPEFTPYDADMSEAGPDDDQLHTWMQEFDVRQPIYKDLRQEARSELRRRIDAIPLRIHDLRSRVKTRESFRDKIARKGYLEPLDEMTDIVGVRVVCLFLDDLAIVDSVVRETFEVVKCEDKTKEAPPERFGYRSVHYDCLVRSDYSGPHYDHIKGRVFEIQVRTILQDAWAVIEHYLGYKGINSIPDEARADFSALVGLFHLADKTFQQIRETSAQKDIEAEAAEGAATQSSQMGIPTVRQDVAIDRSTLKALLRQMYPERRECENSIYSELVEELAAVGVVDINELRQLLNGANDAAIAQEKNKPPTGKNKPTTYSDVGYARTAMSIASPEFRAYRRQKFLRRR